MTTRRFAVARRALRRAAVLGALGGLTLPSAACFATREDVQVLQNDLAVMRAEQSQRDSARAAQLDRVTATLGLVTDSLRTVSGRVSKFEGDVRGDLYSLGQQLIQIQELTGQSQRRLQELRAGLEERSQTLGATAPPTAAAAPSSVPAASSAPVGTFPTAPAATTAAPAPAASSAAGPGPNQLYQLSLDQLRRGSAGAARSGFQDLLRQYPTSDLAPDAQFYIAESYAGEGKNAQADSGYVAVAANFPTSQRAPTALYKHALLLLKQGQTAQGRVALDEVVRRFPRSDEAELARERLRNLK
ncbi:MAG TPA: tol-pal system protein YbgF [Gemmatimonadaceae bacterium]|nr:tol-pal system protein YbgF [Gemmatimonadaceae bacterium]